MEEVPERGRSMVIVAIHVVPVHKPPYGNRTAVMQAK
jgi:hypothetical protein